MAYCVLCILATQNLHFHEFFDDLVCEDCLKNKVPTLLENSEKLKDWGVSDDFRASLDRLRRSDKDNFLMRNKILNTLLAKKVTIKQLHELIKFTWNNLGKFKKDRRFSVTNLSTDAITLYIHLLGGKYLSEPNWLISGQLINNPIEKNLLNLQEGFF
jgi:hypothetical protein